MKNQCDTSLMCNDLYTCVSKLENKYLCNWSSVIGTQIAYIRRVIIV